MTLLLFILVVLGIVAQLERTHRRVRDAPDSPWLAGRARVPAWW